MNWNALMGIASTYALLLPATLILIFRLYTNRSLQALFIYYMITVIYNLMMEGVFPVSIVTRKAFGTINNYLDAPLMLMYLLFFCVDKWKTKIVNIALTTFLFYEVIIAFRFGFNREANVYILGPGILLVLIFSAIFFIRHIRIAIEYGRGYGKTLMLGSTVFSYGCFAILYMFYYLKSKSAAIDDVLLLFHIACIVNAIVMVIGILLIRNHLENLRELKNTRKELQVFFNN
jgi:hypothetical protein